MTALICASPVLAAGNPGQFTDAILKKLSGKYPQWTMRRDPSEPLVIAYKRPGGEEAFMNLHRIYGFCQQASAKECEQVSNEFLENITQVPPPARAEDLRVIVRDAAYVGYISAQERKSKRPVVMAIREPIGDDLFAIIAVDSPKSTAMAGEGTLKELKLTREAAWAWARANMRAKLPSLPDPEKLKTSATAFQDAEYLASLLDDRVGWAKIADAVGPDLFVTAVSDGFVFAGTMPPGLKLEAFRKTVSDDCTAQPRCVSPNIYRFRGGRWVIAE